jgi:Ca2+-binding RTX toxin-like protein
MLDEYKNPKVALDPITKKPILDPVTNSPIAVQYEKEVIERDSFLFSREGYKILGYSQAQATAWYNLAFENIDADVVRGETSNGPTGAVVSRTPLGLVDPTTSYYSTRVKLAKVGATTTITIDGAPKTFQPIPISELNSISGNSISNNNDTLNGDVVIVAGAIVPSPFKDDLIQGFGGNDVIDGKEGNDFLYGNEGADSIKGGNGNDRLFGGAGNDFLEGGSGNDILDGETGNDTMSGGLGDDSYYMDSVGDIIQGEIITGGRDLVYSSVSLNLGEFLEDLILTGDGNITGAGNGLNNLLVGNNKVNILNGLAGDDILYGLNGNDTLKGGDGNDYLNGDGKFGIADGDGVDGNSTFAVPSPVVLGSDLMEGGKGNDTYVVNIIGDVVVENVAEGIDTVISSISYNLGANLENLTLVGSGNITGAGNTLDNVLTGNDKVNLLNGLAGNDTIYGGGGNDTLTGSTGDDILVGEAGNDSLIGGVGFDRFSFGTPGQAFTTATSGFDTIADFQAGTDKIQLQRSSFTALTTLAGSALKASEFAIVTTDVAAATSAGLVVYNQTNDKLFYNANGTAVGFGSGGEFALLSNITTLAASNIAVV